VRGAVSGVHISGTSQSILEGRALWGAADTEPMVESVGIRLSRPQAPAASSSSSSESSRSVKGWSETEGNLDIRVSCGTFINCAGPGALETHRLLATDQH